ncbi:MAG: hypothetical protein CALGDGBN_03302 [Pseudomonadales bacterium]|nr:hypothetical protein [Pseudomonadales bacterium]
MMQKEPDKETPTPGLDKPELATPTTDIAADTVSDAAVAASVAPDETVIPFDAIVASSPPPGVGSTGASGASGAQEDSSDPKTFPIRLARKLRLVLSQNGQPFAISQRGHAGPRAVSLDSRQIRKLIRKEAAKEKLPLRERDVDDVIAHLKAHAEMATEMVNVWYRVAQIPDGVVIAIGDEANTHIRITPGKVEVIVGGTDTLFYETSVSKPMVFPAEQGDYGLLKKYVNVGAEDFVLLIAWISYTLAHPKVPTTKYLHLVIMGDQGSGKSTLSSLILSLVDPSHVGLQIFPGNAIDLSIAAANAHLLVYDNMRGFKQFMADLLCVASTGGAISTRQLYTNAEQSIQRLHCALVLNAIHSLINQPDLAQRCLPIRTLPLSESARRSDAAMAAELALDLPVIFRGFLALIAEIMRHLPTVSVTNPERMLDFVRWLAAMEIAKGVPAGIYQAAYSEALREAQLDSLQENLLASAVLEFAAKHARPECSETPSKLLSKLIEELPDGAKYSREWPRTPIALSKRLNALKASLATQGVHIEFSRGKERHITITTREVTP